MTFVKRLTMYTNIWFRGGNMKIVGKPMEVVSWTDTNGNINPVRFKIANEDESNSVVKINKIICVDKEKPAGNNMLCWCLIVRV
jgi:hypothetical protein